MVCEQKELFSFSPLEQTFSELPELKPDFKFSGFIV